MAFLRRVLLVPLVMAACPIGQAAAQLASVRGVVSDAETHRPLQGATVVLRSDGTVRYGTISDGDGYFVLPRAQPGPYSLSISFVGYETYREDLELSADEELEVQMDLVQAPQALEELLIEDLAEAGLTTVSAGLQTVTPSDVERVPVPGVGGDLAGYIQTLPGIVSQGDRGGQLFIRGGSSDQNLALLDGVPIYQPFHIVSFYSTFPEEIIDHADVFTAGFGAAYGSRVSSVMDVSARNGSKQRFRGAVSAAPFLSGARIEGPVVPNRLSVVLSVRQSLVEEFTPSFLGQKLPYRFGDRFGKAHAFLGAHHSLSITVLDTDDRGDIAGTLKSFEGDFVPDTSKDDREVLWSNTVAAGNYVYRSGRLPVLVQLGGGTSRSENRIGRDDDPEREASIESRDVFLDVDVFSDIGQISFGGRWRSSDLAYSLGGQFQDLESGADDLSELQFYLETTHKGRSGKLLVNPGLALYRVSDRSSVLVEPRIRLTASPELAYGSHQFNLAAGLYHQGIVGLSDERDIGNIFTVWTPAADTLRLPSAIHAVAGWSGRFDYGIGAAVEGFVKEFRELSVPEFSPFPSFTTSLQPADGTAVGFDLRLDLRDRPFLAGSLFDGYFSYTYTDVEYRTATFSYHPAQHRRHQVSALAHTQKEGVGITIQWQFGSGFPFTESAGFDEFHLLTPTTDISAEPGITRVVYGRPFGRRQPNYERVDIWLDKEVDLRSARMTIRAGILNLFNRDNLFYFDLFTLRRVDQMPLIPTVGLKVELL